MFITALVGHKEILIVLDLSHHTIMHTSMLTSPIHAKWKNQHAKWQIHHDISWYSGHLFQREIKSHDAGSGPQFPETQPGVGPELATGAHWGHCWQCGDNRSSGHAKLCYRYWFHCSPDCYSPCPWKQSEYSGRASNKTLLSPWEQKTSRLWAELLCLTSCCSSSAWPKIHLSPQSPHLASLSRFLLPLESEAGWKVCRWTQRSQCGCSHFSTLITILFQGWTVITINERHDNLQP